MVQTEIWYDIFSKAIFDNSNDEIIVEVPFRQLNAAVGHNSKNKTMLSSRYKRKVKFVSNDNLPIYTFRQMK